MNNAEDLANNFQVHPSIQSVTTPEEIEKLHIFLKEQHPEINQETADLVTSLINRAADTFGEDLVRETLSYLATSRRGLRIDDLDSLLGETWNNEKFAEVAFSFGLPIVAAYEDLLIIPSNALRHILLSMLEEVDQRSFHADIAHRLVALPEHDPLRMMEAMYHLLRANKPHTAATYFAKSQGQELAASAGAVGSTYVMGDKYEAAVVAMLEAEGDNRFELYRRFINETFMTIVQNSTPEQAEKLITLIEEKLLSVMGEQNSIDNILLLTMTGLRKAFVYLQKQELERVKEYFDRSIGMIDRLMEFKPGHEVFSWENCEALFNMGMICLDMKQPKAAYHCFDMGFAITQAKVAAEMEDKNRQLFLASWYVTVGRVCQQLNDKEALKNYFAQGKAALKDAIALKANMATEMPENFFLERDLMVMYNDYADFCHECELTEEALMGYENALAIGERLAATHPEMMEFQVAPSISFDRIGKMYADQNDQVNAKLYFVKSLELRKELSAKVPQDGRLLHDLASAYNNLASLQGKFNDITGAEPFLIGQFDALKQAYALHPQVEANVLAWLDAVISLADYYYTVENFAKSQEVLEIALQDAKKLFGAQVSEMLLNRIATIHYKAGLIEIKSEMYDAARNNIAASVELWKQLLAATQNQGYKQNLDRAEDVLSGFSPANAAEGEAAQ